MTHRSLAVLIVLNAALLLALGGVVLTPQTAEAQFGSSAKYTMIAGGVTGRSGQDAVYIVDLKTSQVAPIFFNASSKKIEYFNGRTIGDDLKQQDQGR